jgi:dihydrofolate reductase
MGKKTIVPPLYIIVAVDNEGGFGKGGKIPWHFPEDLKHFQETTKDSVCIMGRKTYEDMAEMILSKRKDEDKNLPILKDRESYVVTSNEEYEAKGATPVRSIRDAVQRLEEEDKRKIFILGGEKMFIEALPFTNTIYMTIIKGSYECDKFFPLKELQRCFVISDGKENDDMYYVTYTRARR